MFDAVFFDDVFSDLATVNSEGQVLTGSNGTGFALTAQSVSRFTGGKHPMQAAGAAALRLTWQHRQSLSLGA